MRGAEIGHVKQKRRGREREREPGSTKDEAASITDGLTFVDSPCTIVKIVGIPQFSSEFIDHRIWL